VFWIFDRQKRRERRAQRNRERFEGILSRLEESAAKARDSSDAYLQRAERAQVYLKHLLAEGREKEARTEAATVMQLTRMHEHFRLLALKQDRLGDSLRFRFFTLETADLLSGFGIDPSRFPGLLQSLSDTELSDSTADPGYDDTEGGLGTDTAMVASSEPDVPEDPTHGPSRET
jgi:hypothetical protein